MKTMVFVCALCCFFMGAANAQFENAQKGDIIEINGIKAIVFSIDASGHGSAMSVKALRGKKKAWCSDKGIAKKIPTYSETDGKANTKAVFDFARENGIPLSKFPAFEWCQSLGDGWYIPSVKQLETFVNFILGNEQEYDWDSEDEYGMDVNNMTTKELNERMMDAGGAPFISYNYSGSFVTAGTYSSTKDRDDKIYIYEMNPSKNVWTFRHVSPSSLGQYTIGRAFYDF